MLLLRAALFCWSSNDLSRLPSVAALATTLAFCLVPCSSGVISRSASSWLWQTAPFLSRRDFEKLPSRCRIVVPVGDNGASVLGRFSCCTNRTKTLYVPHLFFFNLKTQLNKQNVLFRLEKVVIAHLPGHFACLVLQSHELQRYLSLPCITCWITKEFNYRRLVFGPPKQTSVYWFSLRPIWSCVYARCEPAE